MEIKSKKYVVIDYVKIPFKIAPLEALFSILLLILIAAIPSFQVVVTAAFVNTAIDTFKNGALYRIYFPLLMIAVLIGFSWVSHILLSFIKSKLSLKMIEVYNPAVVKKRSCLAYEYIENNEVWELIARASENPSQKIIDGFDNILDIAEYTIKIAGLIILIASEVWWVGIVILVIAIPLFVLALKCGRNDYAAFSEASKYKRKADYLKEVLSSRENVEERTLFRYTNEINKKWLNRFEAAYKIELKALKLNFIKTKIGSIIASFISMFIAFILLIPIYNSKLTAGMYIALVTNSISLVEQISWQLSLVLQKFMKNKLYLKDLTAFSKLKEINGADSLPDRSIQQMNFESLEFKNVHFAYPGTDRKILKGLSMKLENNKQYAFVGTNGAGKTTITKLITGLYDNYEGEILINNKNIKDFTQEQLKAYFSVVYQDFAKYNITLKDNILLSNSGKMQTEAEQRTSVEQAIDMVGLKNDINGFSKGIDTTLGRLDECSADLSGGQWQRVALARNIISDAPIHILDEPTAAIDPISERNLYKLFGEISKGRSTILITHRLGAASNADEILVVDNGIIAEQGTHDELINKQGIYANMYEAQRSWYNECQ